MAIAGHIPWAYCLLTRLPGSRAVSIRMVEFARTSILRRMQAAPPKKDLFYHLVCHKFHSVIPRPFFLTQNSTTQTSENGGEKPPLRNIVSDGALAVIAGSDTTAGALAVIWYHLVRHPSYRIRLQSEIDAYFPPPAQDPLDMSTLARMPYLNACL